MTLKELFEKVDLEDIWNELSGKYNTDKESHEEYRKALDELRRLSPAPNPEGFFITADMMGNGMPLGKPRIEISCMKLGSAEHCHILPPWSEWLSFGVDEGSLEKYGHSAIAAHILNQMTYYGFSAAKVDAGIEEEKERRTDYEKYYNDLDLIDEPVPLREVHAARLMIHDETKDMTPAERAEYYNKAGEKAAKMYGLKAVPSARKPSTEGAVPASEEASEKVSLLPREDSAMLRHHEKVYEAEVSRINGGSMYAPGEVHTELEKIYGPSADGDGSEGNRPTHEDKARINSYTVKDLILDPKKKKEFDDFYAQNYEYIENDDFAKKIFGWKAVSGAGHQDSPGADGSDSEDGGAKGENQ